MRIFLMAAASWFSDRFGIWIGLSAIIVQDLKIISTISRHQITTLSILTWSNMTFLSHCVMGLVLAAASMSCGRNSMGRNWTNYVNFARITTSMPDLRWTRIGLSMLMTLIMQPRQLWQSNGSDNVLITFLIG